MDAGFARFFVRRRFANGFALSGRRSAGYSGRMRVLLLAATLCIGCRSETGQVRVPATEDSGSPAGSSPDTGTAASPLPACDRVVNPGAEAGDISGWVVEEGEWAVKSGSDPVPHEGQYQFFAGQSPSSVAHQDIDISEWRRTIDAGTLSAHLEVQFRDWAGDDAGYLGLVALDASGQELASVFEGPFLDEDWRRHRAHLALPAGTSVVRVRLGSVRNQGSDNDGYFDGVSLCLDEVPPPTAGDVRTGPWLNWVTADAISVLWETHEAGIGRVEWSEDLGFDHSLEEAVASEHHELRITGLEPDTVYAYRIGSEDGVGEVYSFRTAPVDAVPFTFAVWGDNQNGPDIFAEVVDRMEAAHPDFLVSVGDIVQSGTEANYRDELFDPLLDLTLETPFLVAAGNHERIFDGEADLFERYLAQPGDEHCFGWSYGGAYFLFIDTELSTVSGPQLSCIEDALASPGFASADVQIALFHYPPRIEFWAFYFYGDDLIYDGDDEIREVLEPVFEAAGVDLVFNGHNHLYAHTPAGTYSEVTWVTTGGGGGDIDAAFWVTGDWDGITTTLHAHHFLQVAIDGKEVSAQAIGLDGSVLHSFGLTAD